MKEILITLIITLPPTIAAVAALIVGLRGNRKVDDLHVAVNSRLTELLEQTSKASKAEGKAEGIIENKSQ